MRALLIRSRSLNETESARESAGPRELSGINRYQRAHPAAPLMKATYVENEIFTGVLTLDANSLRELGAQIAKCADYTRLRPERNAAFSVDYPATATLLHISVIRKKD